jgi:hypothetical protein
MYNGTNELPYPGLRKSGPILTMAMISTDCIEKIRNKQTMKMSPKMNWVLFLNGVIDANPITVMPTNITQLHR